MPAAAVCLLALGLTFCSSPAAVAKTPKKPSACQKVAKRYQDLATSRKLVTVRRGTGEKGRISACVLPRGKMRTLAAWDDALLRDSASVVDTAGTWVLVDERHSDQYGGVSRLLTRVEVRRNTRRPLSGYACQLTAQLQHCPDGTNYGEAGIAPNGAGAIELTDYGVGATALLAFDTAGAFRTLANGPIEALRVTRTQIGWRQGGIGFTTPL